MELQTYVTAYFALMEAGELLKHRVEQQLKADGGLSYVQFRLLAQLAENDSGAARMTDLADGVVYSRSGLTYQVGLLEREGLVTRGPARDDERVTMVTVTPDGRDRLAAVLPGHVETVEQQLFEQLSDDDVYALADVLTRVRDTLRTAPPRSATTRRAPSGTTSTSPESAPASG